MPIENAQVLWRANGKTEAFLRRESPTHFGESGNELVCSGGCLEVWGCPKGKVPDNIGIIYPDSMTLCPKLFQGVLREVLWLFTNFTELLLICLSISVPKISGRMVFSSVQLLSLTLCNRMNHSTPGLPVQLPEFTQTHAHWVSDAIQPSHPLSSPSPPAPNPSQHQGLFQWVNSLNEVAKVQEFQLQHQSF